MIVYRIVEEKFKDDISGYGAQLFGGRWNPKGKPVLYCAAHISLSMLENLVYLSHFQVPGKYFLLHIEIPHETIQRISPTSLKKKWTTDVEYTRWIGYQFLEQNGFVLQVPSAIVPEEDNFVINTSHPLSQQIKIVKSRPFLFDERLFI